MCSQASPRCPPGSGGRRGGWQLTGRAPAGYFVVNDFGLRRGNIDHIVISTKGILTIETKSHRGVVTCEGETLKRDGKPFEKDFIKQGWREALSIRDLLACHGVSAPKPQPVLLFANADVKVRQQVRGVEIVSQRYFPVYLQRLQTRMGAKEAEKIFEILKLSQSQMFVLTYPRLDCAGSEGYGSIQLHASVISSTSEPRSFPHNRRCQALFHGPAAGKIPQIAWSISTPAQENRTVTQEKSVDIFQKTARNIPERPQKGLKACFKEISSTSPEYRRALSLGSHPEGPPDGAYNRPVMLIHRT